MPTGNPASVKIIENMNWTGRGLEISRSDWEVHKARKELDSPGVYILIGYEDDPDKPKIYIGQGEEVRSRIDSHYINKSFWDKLIIFISVNNSLNKGHITWLEYALIDLAKHHKRCTLDNVAKSTREPILADSEKADTKKFLEEILSILPLLDVKVFHPAEVTKVAPQDSRKPQTQNILDTLIVPANPEGFKKTFLGEHCWYAIRIAGHKLKDIKYIAAYETQTVNRAGVIQYYAEVKDIAEYGDGSKYRVNFDGEAKKINPIDFKGMKQGSMQNTRYTSFERLSKAKTWKDVFPPQSEVERES
ncbi:hypothetical protein CHS0354_027366 [Potamilus streckersoni]|uniref:Uncharacterized protein n=1 Tax=Potamilus streckersoni TaxID=2493646 RepID=A0AAE0SQS2_9BIVA|nr:hypothetical protein CHS0354_027366 [Potamilus streckersoni]